MGAQSGLNEFYDGGMLSVFMFFVAPGFWKRICVPSSCNSSETNGCRFFLVCCGQV